MRCLNSLASQTDERVKLKIFVFDDGSTDGTSEAVRTVFPSATVINGDGSFFWGGGMQRVFEHAISEGHDYYWWLNDDVELFPNCLSDLLTVATATDPDGGAIAVGTCRDRRKPVATYGGQSRISKWHPLKFGMVLPAASPRACDTMNGNCVLIPHRVAHTVGNISAPFKHTLGDFDYGLRARAAGFAIVVAPGYHGICDRNERPAVVQRSLVKEWQTLINDERFLIPARYRVFTQRHGGPLWRLWWLMPYVRFWLTAIFRISPRPH